MTNILGYFSLLGQKGQYETTAENFESYAITKKFCLS